MNSDKLLKNYVSEADQLLSALHPKSAEQSAAIQQEVRKHQRIARLRDDAEARREDSSIWDDN